MKPFVLVVLVAGVAGASERYPLYPEHHVPEESALHRVDEVVSSCTSSRMSRIGPSPEEAARCNVAEARLLSLGRSAESAVLQRLDEGSLAFDAVGRLYDVLARTGDEGLVEPLVSALEREVPGGGNDQRAVDRFHIVRTLERITHVKLAGAAEWRKWADAHRPESATKAAGKPAS